ncbi:MAG: hypothetical protein IH988_02305 [Planctomycetes bacterium]|nr:hypothetical protein [Planctomycetota bacterium]
MKLMGLLFIVIVGLTVLTVAAPPVEAQTVTWYFCIDNGSWDDSASWSDSIDGNGDCNGSTGLPTVNDHVIILSGLTCEADGFGQNCGDLQVEADAVVNISGNHDLQIRPPSGDLTSTITGTIYVKDDGSSLSVNNNDHTFDGTGKIVGENSGAEIGLGGNVELTSQITIEGALAIQEPNFFDATFINQGTVNANASGTLAIIVEDLQDSSAAVWKVTASGAVLKFDIEATVADVLSGDFEVSNGTLDIDGPGFETSGTLTFTGGTIDCAGLTGTNVAKFTGS